MKSIQQVKCRERREPRIKIGYGSLSIVLADQIKLNIIIYDVVIFENREFYILDLNLTPFLIRKIFH